MQEQAHYSQFKKALARSDQLAIEQLFIYANLHVAEAAYTAFELPMSDPILVSGVNVDVMIEAWKELRA